MSQMPKNWHQCIAHVARVAHIWSGFMYVTSVFAELHYPLSPSNQKCLTGFSFISWVFSNSPPRILVVMKNVWSPSHLFLASSFCLTVSDYIGNVHCPPDKSKHLTQTDFCRQKNFLLPGKKDPCCQAKNGSIMIHTGSFFKEYFFCIFLWIFCRSGVFRVKEDI